MSFPQGGTIRFTASAENGDVSIRFRFERLPFSDVDPAFEMEGDSCATIPVIRNPDAVPVAPAWLLVMMCMAIAGFGLRKL